MVTKVPNWETFPQYQLINLIGKGTYGTVYEAIDTRDNSRLAIKKVRALFEEEIEAKQMLREISILHTLNHPCIVSIKSIMIPNRENFDFVYIAMEKADSDLKQFVKSPNRYLTSDQIRYLLYQAACGLRYIHSAHVLHRDIKPGNLLINNDFQLKICDFGLSRSYQRLLSYEESLKKLQEDGPNRNKKVKRVLTGHVVTRWYRAPEVILLEKEYTSAVDVWSLGCVFAEMLMMNIDNCEHYERAPLFPGGSCFPLSPDMRAGSERAGYPSADSDLMNLILDFVGTPSQDDLNFISDNMALEYVTSFSHRAPRNLQEQFPGSNESELELLRGMLMFNPYKRMTLDQLLSHPYFNPIRDARLEMVSTQPLDFIFDREEELDILTLRQLFRQEIDKYENSSQLIKT